MPTLASELRNKLERVIINAREAAEAGARVALEALAVHHHEPYPHMRPAQRELRKALRARARQLGDWQDASGRLAIDHLTAECAYEHWHRMLFARFLAENGLLIEPQENMAISQAEAEELAKEDGVNVWVFASRCAQRMLPQIFRPNDPLLQVAFATEHMLKLEKLLASLPQVVFTSSDALGWVYQFWQSKKKDEVNHSEVKIGADEIAAVTQLFTEPYMVEFLLHNTLGAWWAGKKLSAKDAASANSEDELRRWVALPGVDWEYLRFVRSADGESESWHPAAGRFNDWPKIAAKLRVLDPCCGSGHFLVSALHHLVPIRIAEEGLSAAQAVDAVLRDNLHGLEIDERCCQIAAFALAFTAWTYPGAGGYRPLADLNIACTGIGPQATQEQWLKMAQESGMPREINERERIKNGLLNLHKLFSQAPTLGSLIDPAELPADLIAASYETIQPYLEAILSTEKADDETRERALAAASMVKAVDLLAGKYTLVITNVPYLGRSKQDPILQEYCNRVHPGARADLATCFVERCNIFCSDGSISSIVAPQNWLFLGRYKSMRASLLEDRTWLLVARLGTRAFETISGEIVNVALIIFRRSAPTPDSRIAGIDASLPNSPQAKAQGLRSLEFHISLQAEQRNNPDAAIILETRSGAELLSSFGNAWQGIATSDIPRFERRFWEINRIASGWHTFQSTVKLPIHFGGRESVLFWQNGVGEITEVCQEGATFRGKSAWGKRGVVVSQMTILAPTLYAGDKFDCNCAVITLKNEKCLPALWCFVESGEYAREVRKVNKKLNVTNSVLAKIPFDVAHWQKVAEEKYSKGLPEPESDNPTQWLFHGRPEKSTAPLHVAVTRLLGYRWPAELDNKMQLSNRARALVNRSDELTKFADVDGIACIPSVRGEEPAAERLLALLGAAGVSPAKALELAGGTDLDDWLRNGFFEDHCKLFHDRPFIWHIWDGRKRDGFHALVNYHRLCERGNKGRKLLESMTYSYLGEWITRQKDGIQRGEGGAEDRLAAALELKKRLEMILTGDPPFDLFVRWKPLAQQSIGWEPDINDGIRVNIRPFLASDLPAGRAGAGVLRFKPNIKWTKDRGKEPPRHKAEYPWFWGWDEKTPDFMGNKTFDGNRYNDCHYTNKVKQAARNMAQTKEGKQ